MAKRRAVRAGLSAGLLLALCPRVFALNPALDVSQYSHFSWRYRDGFSKGVIRSIAQTPDGYLWLGTDSGLLRFDGVRAVSWQPPPDQPLPSNYIGDLVVGSDGAIWIGTRSGLVRWKNGKLTQYAELAGSAIQALVQDREGSIWVGAYGVPHGRFCEIRNDAVRCHPELGGLGVGLQGLHEDAKGNLWVQVRSGLWRWKPGTPEFYPASGTAGGETNSMADGENSELLMSATGEVRRLVNGKFQTAYRFPASLRKSYAYRILRDRDGGLWTGTTAAGIVHIRQGQTDVFSEADSLTGNFVSSLFEDREGNIWVATNGGLDRFRELPVVTYSSNDGVSTPYAVLAARDGSVWASTFDGLSRLSHDRVTVYGHSGARVKAGVQALFVGGLPSRLESLFEDSRGRIWVATLSGIGYLERDRFIPRAAPGGSSYGWGEDTAGNLWIANQNLGLIQLTPEHAVHQIPWDTLGHQDYAGPLVADPLHGGVWLGFVNGGIAWFRDGQVRASYSTAVGLISGRVNHLRFDSQGALWVATDGGLSRLNNGHIATLTSKNGLPCEAVHWTIEDDAQSVWLGMPCGLVRVARSDLSAWANEADRAGQTVHTTVFDISDGAMMPGGLGGFGPHVAKSSDGKLWFPSSDGLSTVDPRHLPFNKLPPPVHIEQITADRKIYDALAKLRLPPLARDLQIDYTALSFVAPEKNRFRYKLEGHDRDWQDAGNRRQAFYNDLPPRSYRFRVMASNNDGVWNEAGAFLDFSIAPTYYQTGWFRAAIAAGILGLFWGLFRLRVYQVAHEYNMRLEERVNERTRVARDLHDTLLQSFQGLMLRLQLVDDLLPEGRAKKELEQTLERADQAIEEGRSAVYDLRSSATTMNDLAEAVRALGEELATPDSAVFRLVVEGETRDLHPIIRDEIYRISREALRNAFSHARAHHVETEISYGERVFRLRIRDDGKGIPSEMLEGGRPGHYGLPGMRERAEQIGGKLDIWSGARTGTEIELKIAGSIAYGRSEGRSLFGLFRKKAG